MTGGSERNLATSSLPATHTTSEDLHLRLEGVRDRPQPGVSVQRKTSRSSTGSNRSVWYAFWPNCWGYGARTRDLFENLRLRP